MNFDFPDLSEELDVGYKLVRSKTSWPTYDGAELDRSKFVSASEIGKCARKIKFGKEPDAPVGFARWGYAERGHMIEAWAVNLIRAGLSTRDDAADWALLYAGTEQVSFYDQYQSGTPDGVLVHRQSNAAIVYDFKSIDPRTNLTRLPTDVQVAQVQQNADLVNHCTDFNVVECRILYIDASDLQKRVVKIVKPDFVEQQTLQERAEYISKAQGPEFLPAEGVYMDKECNQCDFKSKCSAFVAKEKEEQETFKQLERVADGFFRQP